MSFHPVRILSLRLPIFSHFLSTIPVIMSFFKTRVRLFRLYAMLFFSDCLRFVHMFIISLFWVRYTNRTTVFRLYLIRLFVMSDRIILFCKTPYYNSSRTSFKIPDQTCGDANNLIGFLVYSPPTHPESFLSFYTPPPIIHKPTKTTFLFCRIPYFHTTFCINTWLLLWYLFVDSSHFCDSFWDS